MGAADRARKSLRLERTESSRLLRALLLSALVHLFFTATYYTGKKLHWWEKLEVPRWMQATKFIPPDPKKPEDAKTRQARQNQEPPMVFVQVSPRQVTEEPPTRDTPYYSTANSQAANRAPSRSLDVPKIEGSQEQVIRTEDIPRANYTELTAVAPQQPVPPRQPAPTTEPEEKPKPAEAPGDIALSRPDTAKSTPEPDPGQAQRRRPASLREALAKKNPPRLAGQKMKQDGGVDRKVDFESLDAKSSPFGDYDSTLILMIQNRWYALLNERDYSSDVRGRVLLRFQLHPDGRVSDLSVAENGVGEMLGLLCQKAVLDPQPYPPWPLEMRRVFGTTRHIQFTFHYN